MSANWIKWLLESRIQSLNLFFYLTPKLFFDIHHLTDVSLPFKTEKFHDKEEIDPVSMLLKAWGSKIIFRCDVFIFPNNCPSLKLCKGVQDAQNKKEKGVIISQCVAPCFLFQCYVLSDSSLMYNMLTVQDLGRNQDSSLFQPLCHLREWCTETSTM